MIKYILLIVLITFLFSCNSKQEEKIKKGEVTLPMNAVEDASERVEDVVETIEEASSEKETVMDVEREAFVPSPFLAKILSQLQIKPIEVYDEFLIQKKLPYDTNSTVVVIPKIARLEDDGYSFSLDSYILVVDSETGVIKQQFYESNDTNGWDSDAVRIAQISIDTANYKVTDDIRAFGVKLYFIGASKPNPYSYSTLSLFISEGKKLQKILDSYEVGSYWGEWDMQCSGEFIDVSKVLIIDHSKTNEYNDIAVRIETTTTNTFPKTDDDCEEIETKSRSKQVLKYKNGSYKIHKKSYVLETKSSCALQIVLEENQYHIKTTKREHAGTFLIQDGYIIFNGLLGDEPKKEVQGTYNEDEITIQNYGNAMNPFTVFGECGDQKYLRLIKTK